MKAVNAGVDMEMVSYTFVKELPELIKEGKVKKSAIDDAVRNILRINSGWDCLIILMWMRNG